MHFNSKGKKSNDIIAIYMLFVRYDASFNHNNLYDVIIYVLNFGAGIYLSSDQEQYCIS